MELSRRESSLLDNGAEGPSLEIAGVHGHRDAAAVNGSPQSSVAARLVVEAEADRGERPFDVTRGTRRQLRRHTERGSWTVIWVTTVA